MKKHAFKLIYLLCLMIICAKSSNAKILLVPQNFLKIQDAINHADVHDTVLVSPGIYYENINFHGKNLVLTSLYYINSDTTYINNTIIDGGNPVHSDTASCILLVNGEDSTTYIQGFTIRNGKGTKWKDIHNNLVYREAGGILMEFSSAIVRNNIIINNEAINRTGTSSNSAGGGAIRSGDGNPQIINNIIMYNKGRYGAGIVFNYSKGLVLNNIIAHNSGGEDYGGGGVWVYGDDTLNQVVNIVNNTIANNSVSATNPLNAQGRGGGILILGAKAIIKNNIIWGNTQSSGNSVIKFSPSVFHVSYNNIQQTITGTGVAKNNIKVFPAYDSLNYYLKSNSPCIDAGDSSAIYNDKLDNTSSNIVLYPSLGTYRNDMGATGGPFAFLVPNKIIMSNYVNKIENESLVIYPNPSKEKINLDPKYKKYNYLIYNLQGKIIQKGILESTEIEISNLTSETYLLEITSNNRIKGTALFVKN